MNLDVYLLPQWAPAERLAGRAVVVIDVLRATTTITQALVAGAREIIPCLEIAEAQQRAAAWNAEHPSSPPAVLGGERAGTRIPGFHCGNSPTEYTATTVGGKTLFFTTTNGTRAMQECHAARRVLLGSFNNLSAIAETLAGEPEITLLCAGTDQAVTAEDALLAGALVDRWCGKLRDAVTRNDEATLVQAAWRGIQARGAEMAPLLPHLLASRGGRNLSALGMDDDVAWAARCDTTDVVAELDLAAWRITRAT